MYDNFELMDKAGNEVEETLDDNLEAVLNKLNDLGYIIDSAKNFDEMISNGDFEEKLAELTKLKEEALQQQKENEEKQKDLFINFVKDVNLDELVTIVESATTNEFFKQNSEYNSGYKEFMESIEEFKKTFGIVEEYYSDLRELENYSSELEDINHGIEALDNDTKIDQTTKTRTAVKLAFAKKQVVANVNKYLKSVEDKKEAIDNFDLVDLRDKVSSRINDLDAKYYKNLNMDSASMEKIFTKITKIKKTFERFNFNLMVFNDKTKTYEELCEKYGIKDSKEIKKELTETPVKSEKDQNKEKGQVDEMVDQIRDIIERSTTQTEDTDVAKAPKVEELKKSVTTPTVSSKPTKESKIGIRHRVKNIRRAIIEPYGKAILMGAAVGSIAAIMGSFTSPYITNVITASGLGIATAALYTSVVGNSNNMTPEYANPDYYINNPEEQVSVFSKIKNLLVSNRRRRAAEKNQNNTTRVPEEQPQVNKTTIEPVSLPEVEMGEINSLPTVNEDNSQTIDSSFDNQSNIDDVLKRIDAMAKDADEIYSENVGSIGR